MNGEEEILEQAAPVIREYGAENIKVLSGLDPVRKVPAMYIGNTGFEGLHHMVYELVDNSLDEALEGYAQKIAITIHTDNSVTVEDDGRGIPVAIHHDEGVSALEIVLSKLHAGGKFDKDSYKVSAGLHGVGLSVVNALAEYLEAEIRREGQVYFTRYERGVKQSDVQVTGETRRTGTKIRFKPDDGIFESIELSSETLAKRMRELSFLNNGIHIILTDERKGKTVDMKYEGGIRAFVNYLNTSKTPIIPSPIYVRGSKPPLDDFEVAFTYNEGYNESIFSFVNNVNTHEGGSHVTGFRTALTRVINNYGNEYKLLKDGGLSGDDLKEGLVAIINVKHQSPQFEGQTKTKLGNSEVKGFVEAIIGEQLMEFLQLNNDIAKAIINKALETKRAREAARKAKEIVRAKNNLGTGVLPGKLADCQESNPDHAEIFIVEGDSAGGSAKQGRDRANQAILPLRGKILNVERVQEHKALSNQEIKALYIALGMGGNGLENLRYKKIIIMTDADVDGAHIRTLLLTFFYRKMPEVVENGYLYIAQPPLYRVSWGKQEVYMKDDDALERFVINRGVEKTSVVIEDVDVPVSPGQLKNDVEQIRQVERYLLSKDRSGTAPREALIAMFEAHILNRWDFLARDKLQQVADKLTGMGYETRITMDDETNLYSLSLNLPGNGKASVIDYEFVGGTDYKETLSRYTGSLSDYYHKSITVLVKGEPVQMRPYELLLHVIERGKEGVAIQRYKGLGEMNPDQLWKTTMDPQTRTLLKVSIDDGVSADEVFTMLMGTSVESRRNFIQENSLDVRNLDI
jgi:DNA gyrase subunit B